MRSPHRTIIIDAKFYREALAGRHGQKVRSDHLYQIVTYLQNEIARRPDTEVAGMLLYPEVGRSLRLKYRLLGIPVLVSTVDLGKEWSTIEDELRQLIDDFGVVAEAA